MIFKLCDIVIGICGTEEPIPAPGYHSEESELYKIMTCPFGMLS